MRLKLFCVVSPEKQPILETVQQTEKMALHKFDMLQPLSWPLAQRRGFQVKQCWLEFDQTKPLKKTKR